jgi:hypothetical protein
LPHRRPRWSSAPWQIRGAPPSRIR